MERLQNSAFLQLEGWRARKRWHKYIKWQTDVLTRINQDLLIKSREPRTDQLYCKAKVQTQICLRK
jgi:hypothetical protein